MNKIEQGIDYIRTHGSASGEALANVLGCPKKNVQPMLYLALTMGYLATSKQGGNNIYRISESVPGGMSWEEFKTIKRVPKVSTRAKPPPKAKEIVEKPERTPAEVRNALADLFERRALGLPAPDDDAENEAKAAPVGTVESAAQGYEVIELAPGPEPVAASAVPPIPVSAQVDTAAPVDEVLFLFGHDGRLQVILGDQRIICTREETAAVGRMMSALEPVWNV